MTRQFETGSRLKSSRQGQLDGLCGPYAIKNALTYLGHESERADVFQTACSAVSRSRWPALLWEGTTFGDLKKMIRVCMGAVEGVEVRYPFWRTAPLSNAAYWQYFDAIFDDEDVVCGIVGITRPSYHWLVIIKDGGRIVFLDSDAHWPSKRVNRTSLHAVERGPRSKTWVIDRSELVVFRRTS